MSHPSEALLHPRIAAAGDTVPAVAAPALLRAAAGAFTLTVHDTLDAVEADWRRFEATADCTVFQSFTWQSLWRKHIGGPEGVQPAIVVGRIGERIVFIFPLAIERGRLARRLTWHAGDLGDYNAPLLAPDFAALVDRAGFLALFATIRRVLSADPRFRFDAVAFEKMPEAVGTQANPFIALCSGLNPSGAYVMGFSGAEWEAFYTAKRSSATRRRDRTKRKRLGDIGAVRFVTPEGAADIEANLDVLAHQKSRQLLAMGAENVFARPGFREFFADLATSADGRTIAHVSHLAVGAIMAAANFGLVFRGRYYHILASYDAGEVSRFGPGAVHLQELMRYAIQRQCTAFDFTIGDEHYKREWADVTLLLHDHRSAVTPAGWLVSAPAEAVGRFKRIVKQNPRLWALASRTRATIATLRRGRTPAGGAPANAVTTEERDEA
jgi:CelD/BcsL family acetyltransferase involved in cellulose biosynthesis